MMYAKLKNNIVEKFPYSIPELHADNPSVSFPEEMSESLLLDFNVVIVQMASVPSFDERTQNVVVEKMPVKTQSGWVLNYIVQSKTQQEIQFADASKADDVRAERNGKLKASDWTQLTDAPVDSGVWATYRQSLRDITKQAGFPWSVTWPKQP